MIKKAYSYKDVSLIPRYSELKSRDDAETKSLLTRNLSIEAPLISANMDSVTTHRMAISMARYGGVGVIHRNFTIAQQVAEVEKVKRTTKLIVENPYTLKKSHTLEDVMKAREEHGVKSFPVVNVRGKLVGLVTNRDVDIARARGYMSKRVSEMMTPLENLVICQNTSCRNNAEKIFLEHKVGRLPVLTDNGTLVGMITRRDMLERHIYPYASRDEEGSLMVGAAIGVQKNDYLERAEKLVQAGVDFLVIDIAHGDSKHVINTLKDVKENIPDIDLIAGNVATAEGTKRLIKAGADAIKVGIGPGRACKTRLIAGAGVPQITAIMDCYSVARKNKIPLIADGGVTESGDLAKAIAAGAHTVMLGQAFAGTDESPGDYVLSNGLPHKLYKGMASAEAIAEKEKRTGKIEKHRMNHEGEAMLVPYKGKVKSVLAHLIDGLKSGMSYVGARNIEMMHQGKPDDYFREVSQQGREESIPRH